MRCKNSFADLPSLNSHLSSKFAKSIDHSLFSKYCKTNSICFLSGWRSDWPSKIFLFSHVRCRLKLLVSIKCCFHLKLVYSWKILLQLAFKSVQLPKADVSSSWENFLISEQMTLIHFGSFNKSLGNYQSPAPFISWIGNNRTAWWSEKA